jgi:sugar/nucleoside kinase (ribokinase family)
MPPIPEVVCFGMLTPVEILVVDELPAHNCGALVQDASEFIFDDAAIVACLLRQWDVSSGLIGTTLGNDYRGRNIARRLKALGVLGKVRLSSRFTTPYEVDVSDRTGARTYFWQRKPEVLDTLDTADLSLLQGARLLYVDWYDGDHILCAMDEANRLDIPAFLNLEHGHQDPDILSRYVKRAAICQAVTDAAQCGECDPLTVAHKLLDAGAKIAVITLAGEGCLVVRGKNSWRVWPPEVQAVDGCGAGTTFSMGFIYGFLRGWTLKDTARFATAAASLKVGQVGLKIETVARVKQLARQLKVEKGK